MKKEISNNKNQNLVSKASVENILSNLQFPKNKELKSLFKILNNNLYENEKLLSERNLLNEEITKQYHLLNKYNSEIKTVSENIIKVKEQIEQQFNYKDKIVEINSSLNEIILKLKKVSLNDLLVKRKKFTFDLKKETKKIKNRDDLKEITTEFQQEKNQFITEFEHFQNKIKVFPSISIDFEGFDSYFERYTYLNTEAKNLKLKISENNHSLAKFDQKINELRENIKNDINSWLLNIKNNLMIEINNEINSDFRAKIKEVKQEVRLNI